MLIKIKKQENKGFTIVETLIVLAVSSFLFAIISVSISGQVQRYRHRDAMYRLQQDVQNIVNDVQTGRFNIVTDGKSDDLLIGKKILFCFNYTNTPCSTIYNSSNGSPPNRFQYKVNVTKRVGSDSLMASTSRVNLLNRLEYRGSLIKDSLGSWVRNPNNYAGVDIRMDTEVGRTSKSSSVKLYNYENYPGQNNTELTAYKLCFRGSQVGSLEIGGIDLGTNVKMSIQDEDCKRILNL